MIDVGSYESLGELLRDACVQFKSNTALIEASRKREAGRWTFLDFMRAAGPVAAQLQKLGIGAGDRVAIVMSNQAKWLMSAYAIFYRGGVLVPLDYKLEAEEQAALLAHARPSLVIVEYAQFRRFEGIPAPCVLVTEAPADADLGTALRWEEIAEVDAPDFVPRARTDVATIVYSSGTGGRPKGCMLSHRAYLCQLEALLERFPMAPGDRYFSILPTNHAIDFMCGFVGPFACGATVVHQRTLRPELILSTLQRYQITHMAVVPLVLSAFERAIREKLDALPGWQRQAFDALVQVNGALTEKRPNHALSRRVLAPIHAAFGGHLRRVFCGGAPTDRDQAEFFYRLGIPVIIGYGLTEACTVLTVNGVRPFRADSVGSPVRGVELKIATDRAGGIGEVLVRGPTLMEGYLEEPELTAETLIDGWLHTGDLGWVDASNHLHLVGRSKNMIVTAGGKNVYPEDVEGAFGGVGYEEMAIYASQALWPGAGLENGELVAVVRADDVDDARTAIRTQNRRLPDFKRVTGIVVWDEPFPRTASMKLKRAVLAEALRAQVDRSAVEAL